MTPDRTASRPRMAPSWQRNVAGTLWICGTASCLALAASARSMASSEHQAGDPHGLGGVYAVVGMLCLPIAAAMLILAVQVWRGRWRGTSLVAASTLLFLLVIAMIASLLRPVAPPLVALLTVAGTIALDVLLARAPLCLTTTDDSGSGRRVPVPVRGRPPRLVQLRRAVRGSR